MSGKLLIILTALTGLFAAAELRAEENGSPMALIEYFYQPGCDDCKKIKAFILPRLKEDFTGKYKLVRYDIGKKENIIKLADYQEKLNITENKPVSMIVNRKYALTGYDPIEKKLFETVKKCLSEPGENIQLPADTPSEQEVLARRARRMTLSAIILGGLADGINPCVFSTLVFFLSLLTVFRISGRKLVLAGSVYCLACFLTYLALGFALFKGIKTVTGFDAAKDLINYAMALILLILAYLSFRDAWFYGKTGKADTVSLQLPEAVKARIHAIMRMGLGYRHLVPGAFIIGILVTVLESVCTGQVYIPILVLLVKNESFLSKWFGYLLLYNLMFIVPLVLIFVIAYFGLSTGQFLAWSKGNVVPSKILLGLLFLGLAGMILIM